MYNENSTPSFPPLIFLPTGGVGSKTPPVKQLLTRTQVLSGLKKMILLGRRPRIFGVESFLSVDDDSINNLSESGNACGGGGALMALTPNGSGRTNLDVLFDAAAAIPLSAPPSSSGTTTAARGRNGAKVSGGGSGGGGGGGGEVENGGDPKADLEVLLRTMEEGVSNPGGIGPLEWDWLSCEEAGDKARKLYRQAAHTQVRTIHLLLEECV